MEKRPKNKAGFGNLVVLMMRRRWLISAMVLLTFLGIVTGILISIHAEAPIDSDWKEILLLLLGAFIGSFGKVIEYWFTDNDKDKMLFQKMDEEDGESLSNTNN
jgi:H+/Cl- antiporter ClcA|tara:strand:- start:683 stop:994 length:312 start_codon:yes stop_codon:yes gene_type:complete